MAEKKKQTEFPDAPVDVLKKRIEEAKKARDKYEKNWDKNYDFYEGRHWTGIQKIHWSQSEPVYNKIFEFVETMRGYLADNKWGVDAIPSSIPSAASKDADVVLDKANKVNNLLDFLWGDLRMQNKLAQVLQYTFLYGTGIMKVTWNPDNYSSGVGGIEVDVLSPRYVYPDPDATDMHDASYFFEHHPVSYRWVIERYPHMRDKIVSSGEQSTTQQAEGQAGEPSGTRNQAEAQRLDIWECWYHDSTLSEELDADGNPQLKYPNGRHTIMTEGGIVLDDNECLYTHFPYIRFIEIPRPAQFFGDCTISRAIDIQISINKILQSIIDNGLWLIHGVWIADSTSGVTPKTLAGYGPRSTIVKNTGTEVRRDAGVPLPGHVFETLRQQVEAFNRVVALPDVLLGIVPSRQPVQTTMMQQESGEVRTRERQRRVEESLEDFGSIVLDIVQNHWSDKRMIRGKRQLGGYDMFEMSKDDLKDWAFDVRVVPGSTGPIDRVTQMQMVKEARVEMGVMIPDNYIVNLMNLPGLNQAMMEAEQESMEMAENAASQEPQETIPEDDPFAYAGEQTSPQEMPTPEIPLWNQAPGGGEDITPEEMAAMDLGILPPRM